MDRARAILWVASEAAQVTGLPAAIRLQLQADCHMVRPNFRSILGAAVARVQDRTSAARKAAAQSTLRSWAR